MEGDGGKGTRGEHTQHLRLQQVLPRRHVGDVDIVPSLRGDELVDSPIRGGPGVLPQLDPDVSSAVVGGGGYVHEDGALMGRGDDIVRRRARVVVPLERELVARLDGHPSGRYGVVNVAGHRRGVQILHRVVVGWASDVYGFTWGLSVRAGRCMTAWDFTHQSAFLTLAGRNRDLGPPR